MEIVQYEARCLTSAGESRKDENKKIIRAAKTVLC